VGDELTVSGRLTSENIPISGEFIQIHFGLLSSSTPIDVFSDTTDANGYFSVKIKPNMYGKYQVEAIFPGSSNYYDSTSILNDITAHLKITQGWSGTCVGIIQGVYFENPEQPLCDDDYQETKRTNNVQSQYSNLQYAASFAIYGNVVDKSHSPVTIEVKNPCGKTAAVYQATVKDDLYAAFSTPQVSASGQNWDVSGIYTITAKYGGQVLATNTFSMQSSGPTISSSSDPACSGSIDSTGSTISQGDWKGSVSGKGETYTKTNHYTWDVDGVFNFKVLSDGSITGTGTSGAVAGKSYGFVDNYGKEYGCWSVNFQTEPVAFTVAGNVNNGVVSMYLKDGSPSKMGVTIHCDFPGFHKRAETVEDPYFFDKLVYLDLKKGSSGFVTTSGPYESPGKIDWKFTITQEGKLDSKFEGPSSTFTDTPTPTPDVTSTLTPTVDTDWNQVCKEAYGSDYKYNSNTDECYKPTPEVTPPPQVTPTSPSTSNLDVSCEDAWITDSPTGGEIGWGDPTLTKMVVWHSILMGFDSESLIEAKIDCNSKTVTYDINAPRGDNVFFALFIMEDYNYYPEQANSFAKSMKFFVNDKQIQPQIFYDKFDEGVRANFEIPPGTKSMKITGVEMMPDVKPISAPVMPPTPETKPVPEIPSTPLTTILVRVGSPQPISPPVGLSVIHASSQLTSRLLVDGDVGVT